MVGGVGVKKLRRNTEKHTWVKVLIVISLLHNNKREFIVKCTTRRTVLPRLRFEEMGVG